MIYAKVLLFFNIILMLCLHIYARWYLLQSRHQRNRIRHRAQLVFFTDDRTNVVVTTVIREIDATSSLLFPCYFTMRRITWKMHHNVLFVWLSECAGFLISLIFEKRQDKRKKKRFERGDEREEKEGVFFFNYYFF